MMTYKLFSSDGPKKSKEYSYDTHPFSHFFTFLIFFSVYHRCIL